MHVPVSVVTANSTRSARLPRARAARPGIRRAPAPTGDESTPAMTEGTTTVLTNPTLVVEVLSEGTELFDRGEKFEGYRSIPSLRHFLMVATTHPLVEHYTRGDGDAWILRTYGPGETVRLHDPDIALSVDALYAAPPDA